MLRWEAGGTKSKFGIKHLMRLGVGFQNLAHHIGTYFWPSSVSGPPNIAMTSTKSNIKSLKISGLTRTDVNEQEQGLVFECGGVRIVQVDGELNLLRNLDGLDQKNCRINNNTSLTFRGAKLGSHK